MAVGRSILRVFEMPACFGKETLHVLEEAKMRRFAFIVTFIGTLWIVICGLNMSTPDVQAQPYPNKPVQLIIPIPAGGGGDITGRVIADELGKILKTQIIVSNKPGAGNALGTEFVAKSKKDGYTIGYTSSAAIVFAPIMNPENVSYDMLKDFDPLALHVFFSSGFAVQESLALENLWRVDRLCQEESRENPCQYAGFGNHCPL